MSDGMILPSGATVGEVRRMLAELDTSLDQLELIIADGERIVRRALDDSGDVAHATEA